jgi:enoyl-CoA hydratase/carnithine racemase
MMAEGQVRLEIDGHVATLVLDRPEKLNAMTVAMDAQLNAHVYAINNDKNVRAVVLTGAGERSFCAGSDINGLSEYGDPWQYRNRFDARLDYARAVWLIRKPVVAAIGGYCIGGGLEMALASDIRLATPASTFSAGEINWGWHGGSGATQLLTHAIGPGHAARMLLTGDRFSTEEVDRFGLLQEIVDVSLLQPQARNLAAELAELSPIAVERTKYMIRVAQNVPLEAGLLVENDSLAYLMRTDDAAEGQAAFAQKRPPRYEGR